MSNQTVFSHLAVVLLASVASQPLRAQEAANSTPMPLLQQSAKPGQKLTQEECKVKLKQMREQNGLPHVSAEMQKRREGVGPLSSEQLQMKMDERGKKHMNAGPAQAKTSIPGPGGMSPQQWQKLTPAERRVKWKQIREQRGLLSISEMQKGRGALGQLSSDQWRSKTAGETSDASNLTSQLVDKTQRQASMQQRFRELRTKKDHGQLSAEEAWRLKRLDWAQHFSQKPSRIYPPTAGLTNPPEGQKD